MIINKKLFAMETKKMILLVVVSLGLVTFLTGCEQELVDNAPQTDAKTLIQTEQTGELLPWEKVRYDYSYLENKVGEANQYLTRNKLTLEDLKQLHEIGNLLFGEYRTALARNWETRTPDFMNNLMDDALFDSEYERRAIYSLISLDYDRISEMENAPNVHILTEHIGERGAYIFVTVRVYAPHFYGREWGYTILQLKKTPGSKYGWKIYYNEQEVPGFTDRGQTGAWTVELNERDDFSDAAWKKQQGVVTDEEWETRFTREREQSFRGIEHTMTRSRQSSKYNRQAAASYAYTYALSYNPDYYFWKDANNTDCANFSSQCLTAGGLPQDATWKYFYNKKDLSYSFSTHANDRRSVGITGLDFDFEYLRSRDLGVKIEY